MKSLAIAHPGTLIYCPLSIPFGSLKGWPVALSIVVMAWGTILTARASGCGYVTARTWAQGGPNVDLS